MIGDIVMMATHEREQWTPHSVGCLGSMGMGRVIAIDETLHGKTRPAMWLVATSMAVLLSIVICVYLAEVPYFAGLLIFSIAIYIYRLHHLTTTSKSARVYVQALATGNVSTYDPDKRVLQRVSVPQEPEPFYAPDDDEIGIAVPQHKPPAVAKATPEEWSTVRAFKAELKAQKRWGKPDVAELFQAWGGEDRCCLRVTRANDLDIDVAIKQFNEICDYRTKYNIGTLDPSTVGSHPCKPYWVGELPGLATGGHTRGCVVQVFKLAYVKCVSCLVVVHGYINSAP
jgi:hypothetical protein